MADTFEGFVTKYALTSGIIRNRLSPTAVDGLVVDASSRYHIAYHGEGKEWHRTWESAVARAEEMCKAKLASMRRSMAKIEALTFTEPK